jgi:16S rRNA (guanine527-N7)-methyltransferase
LQLHRLQKEPGAPLSANAIASAAAELGLRLSEAQSDALARYTALLMRWNAVHNLTAIESPAHVLTHHLLDSLAIVPEIQIISGERLVNVLDVGAGGGLPGIPLAIAAPYLHVTLIDKVQKKIAFLTQAKLELALDNVTCVHARVETLQAEAPFELIVARAFASLAQFVGSTRHLLARNGWWCAMKGTLPAAELDELKRLMPDVRVARTVRLHVPHLNAERHLVLMQAAR